MVSRGWVTGGDPRLDRPLLFGDPVKPLRLVVPSLLIVLAVSAPAHAQTVDIPPAPDSVITNHTIVLELTEYGGYEINHQAVPREQLGAQIRAIYSPRPAKVLLVMWAPRRAASEVMNVVQIARTEGVTVYRAPDGFGTPMEILQAGQWTGSTVIPSGDGFQLTYDVTHSDSTIQIVVDAGARGRFSFSDVRLAHDTLTFTFQPGPTVQCILPRQADGSYSGKCTDPTSGDTMTITMVPPKQE
jgi:biopolymer transport protein ExbD